MPINKRRRLLLVRQESLERTIASLKEKLSAMGLMRPASASDKPAMVEPDAAPGVPEVKGFLQKKALDLRTGAQAILDLEQSVKELTQVQEEIALNVLEDRCL